MTMDTLNWFDYAIIIIIALSSLISLIRGFIREALSLASWIIAFWVALTFSSMFESYLQPYITANSIRYTVTFVLLFIATLLIGAVVNFVITHLIEKTGLSGTDRLLGVFFGFARGVLLVAIVLLAAQMTTLPQDQMWMQSRLIPVFTPVESWLANYIPKNIQQQLPNSNLILQAEDSVTKKVASIRKATVDTQMMNDQMNVSQAQPTQQGKS